MTALKAVVGATVLMIPLDTVESVLRTPHITVVPGSPPSLAGLFNHQGEVFAAVHPLQGEKSSGRHAVVVRTARYGRFALLCDWAEDVESDASAADHLDLEALGASVVNAYREITPRLPPPDKPSAVIRIKKRTYSSADGPT